MPNKNECVTGKDAKDNEIRGVREQDRVNFILFNIACLNSASVKQQITKVAQTGLLKQEEVEIEQDALLRKGEDYLKTALVKQEKEMIETASFEQVNEEEIVGNTLPNQEKGCTETTVVKQEELEDDVLLEQDAGRKSLLLLHMGGSRIFGSDVQISWGGGRFVQFDQLFLKFPMKRK